MNFPFIGGATSSDVQTVALGASKFKGLFTLDYALMAAGVMILTVPQIIFFLLPAVYCGWHGGGDPSKG